MNAKNLPIQVIEEWQRIAQYIRETISESGLPLDAKQDKRFGLRVTYKRYKRLYFEVIDYEPAYVANQFHSVQYDIVRIPENRYTSIDESTEEIESYGVDLVMLEFKSWIQLVKEYEKYESMDLTAFFPSADEDSFVTDAPDVFTEKDKILPYCLKTLAISNFQGVKRTGIENLPVDTNWIFLVGENGFGKTTILQALALALRGSKVGNTEYLQDGKSLINVEYKDQGMNQVNDPKLNPKPLSHFAAYGPVRLNMQADATISEKAQKSGALYSLFKTDGVLLNIESDLIIWHLKGDPRFRLVRNAFCKLIPNLTDVRFNSANNTIEYVEKDMSDNDVMYDPLPFDKIASGFRSILGVAGDLIVRLSANQKDIEDPSKLAGIVIIDELDLHWHPKLQKQIPQLLTEVFPNIQFIASTHSPLPLLGAPQNSVVLKVNRTKEEGITVERLDVDLKTLTPNLLLTSGVFDMDNIFSSQIEDITEVRTEDTFDELEKNNEISEYLENFEKSSSEFPDELFESK